MATPSEAEDGLEDRVRTWLDSQGYPLEMTVAKALSASGFEVTQSEFYQDAHTSTYREIDVVGEMKQKVGQIFLTCRVIAECKVSRNKPWILFTAHQNRPDSVTVFHRASSKGGFLVLYEMAKVDALYTCPIFHLPDRPGYGVTQAFTSGRDVAYDACLSISQAAKGLVSRVDSEGPGLFKTILIVFQVVVIDGRLFEAYLDPTDALAVSEITQGLMLWRNPIVDTGFTLIHVVTLPELTAFAGNLASACRILLSESKARPDVVSSAYDQG